MRKDELAPWLADLERRVDEDTEAALESEWRAFLDGRFTGAIFSPRRRAAAPPSLEWPHIPINDALEDFGLMARRELAGVSAHLAAGDGAPLAVRCNYGTGILPSLFGAEMFPMARALDTLPTARPLAGGRDAIRRRLESDPPDLRAGWGGRVWDMADYFVERWRPYPKLRRWVRLYHPDLQGPMDVAELLWGSALFTDVYDEPDLVRALLGRITETYERFMDEWLRRFPVRDGLSAHWALMHRGAIMVRDDSAMNFSPEMFDAFIAPWDGRLLRRYGGAIHFCGRGDHYLARAARLPGLTGINLTQPHLNNLETIYAHTVDRGLPLLGFDRATAEAALAAGRDLRGRVHAP
jgi:hypothetical protein